MKHLEIIAGLSWQVAKTMPEMPHQYTVRGRPPGNEALFFALHEAIASDGVFMRYKRHLNRYLHPGDGRKYWAMPFAYVINRMRLVDDLARVRLELRDETPYAIRRARQDGCAYLVTPLGHVLRDTPENRQLAAAELEGIARVIVPP